jgi:uncharacterized peroxidase-related enzyme
MAGNEPPNRKDSMTWIKTIDPSQAEGRLEKAYRRVAGPGGQVDNILMAHSLRPQTLEGHMALYKNVLHHLSNTLPKSLLEALGVYVSMLNGCDYCVDHHATGLRRLLGDEQAAEQMIAALKAGEPERAFTPKEALLFGYAETLTQQPSELSEGHIKALRAAGFDDGEILEANQVIAYFAYANRTVLGLGVNVAGEQLGLSPGSSDSDDWSHDQAQNP